MNPVKDRLRGGMLPPEILESATRHLLRLRDGIIRGREDLVLAIRSATFRSFTESVITVHSSSAAMRIMNSYRSYLHPAVSIFSGEPREAATQGSSCGVPAAAVI